MKDNRTYLFAVLVCLMLLVDFYLILVYVPEEKTQGLVQKIFYFHVSSAFATFAGFLLAGFFSILYLLKKNLRWDRYVRATTSAGLLFCTMVLVSGPIWAKPAWGTWWTWDPRLTTTLLLWLIFFSTILLRLFFGADPKGKTFAAVLTLFGVLDIPLIFFAVKLWRGIHPSVLGKEGSMPFEMKFALYFTMAAVFSLFALICLLKYRVLALEDKQETS